MPLPALRGDGAGSLSRGGGGAGSIWADLHRIDISAASAVLIAKLTTA